MMARADILEALRTGYGKEIEKLLAVAHVGAASSTIEEVVTRFMTGKRDLDEVYAAVLAAIMKGPS